MADTIDLHPSVATVAHLGVSEELVAEGSPIRDNLPGRSSNPTTAAEFLLHLKCSVTCERCCATGIFQISACHKWTDT
jgi:hypothetical protein